MNIGRAPKHRITLILPLLDSLRLKANLKQKKNWIWNGIRQYEKILSQIEANEASTPKKQIA